VVGLMAGYGHTDLEYEASPNTQAMDAWSYGVYAGLVHGGLFVDAVVNANSAVIDTDAPGFNFFPEGTILSSRLTSVGSQVEAGWRLPFQGGFFVEPLAGVSYLRSKMGDLQIKPDDGSRPGLVVSFEDPSSFRAGVGARFGLDRDFGGLRTQLSFLARTWNDLEGKNTAVIHNLAFPDDPDIRVVDDFSGTFNELTAGASVWSPGGTVSGFLNLGGKFGDDYEATSVSAGVRVHW
jgi:outer membrane autotransporter protein